MACGCVNCKKRLLRRGCTPRQGAGAGAGASASAGASAGVSAGASAAAGETVVKIDLSHVDASIARKGFCVEDVRHVEDEDKV